MTATKVNMPVFRKIEPEMPECQIDELVDAAQCCEDGEYEVTFAGSSFTLCGNCMTDIQWLFENIGG